MTVKLIRDKVPVDDGGREIQCVQGDELVDALFRKLQEEALEASRAQTAKHQVEELADCLQVLWSLAEELGIRRDEIEQARVSKFIHRGGFRKGRMYERP